ncbi:hypothetical protein [Streptomyces sp. NBC_01089]|uniref:hypothetical protein n=1 Tax=Streptomyces sp. NBC_01089 TaxID=2903747 RepID=UPI00386F5FA6|nr:hypothetical protein OG510_25765 [Streptomyces sp. NBC_01089]
MISTAIRLARVGSRSELIAAAFMGLSYPCVMIAALIPNIWFFAAATFVTYVSDWFLHQRRSYLINRLAKVRAGLSIRFLLRELLLILLLARLQLAEQTVYYAAVACFLLFYGLQAAHGTLTTLIRLRRTMPVVTRNVDLGAIPIPGPPPRRLLNRAAEKMLHLDAFAMVGLLIAAKTGTDDFGYLGILITLVLGVLYIAVLVPFILKGRRVPSAAAVLAGLDGWLREYRPTVALYFSGSRDSAYQVNMWLETMAQTEGRPLIILRERAIVSQLASTAVPVVCVPGGVHLMNMDLSTVRVALYAANVGKNIHMLRVPTIKHVFIGHGDSDKLASVNPYSKAYDEVWTAGRAGRDRYALADVGVRDEDIVEVGRPQLAPIESWTGTPKQQIPTVLYAPTWEGWDDNPGNTSLLLAGENIVKRLLGAEQPVRVLYKPHPFTGTRSAQAKAAHLRITAMVEKAAADRAAEPRWTEQAAAGAADRAAAQAELTRIEAKLDELAARGPSGADESEESRASLADPEREDETAALRTEWNRAYWRTFGYWEHRVITGGRPHLYDCFNESDGMVSDISSVVSDFIASGKPYAVTDSAELGADEFKRQNTAVRAAVILSNTAKEIDQLLTAITESSADPLADARRELKQYLLGPDEPTSMEQFNAAVRALTAKAEARNAAVAQRTGATEPEGSPGLNDSDATRVDSAVGD